MYATAFCIFALSEIFIQGDFGADKKTEKQDFIEFIELTACLL